MEFAGRPFFALAVSVTGKQGSEFGQGVCGTAAPDGGVPGPGSAGGVWEAYKWA